MAASAVSNDSEGIYTGLVFPHQDVYSTLGQTSRNSPGAQHTDTQDEDVTCSEMKTMNPSSSNTVCEKSGQSSHPYRLAAVCLGLLCALLLVSTLVLCVLYTSMSENFSMLKRDLEELRGNSTTVSNERDQQQGDYNSLQQENGQLLKDYNQLLRSYRAVLKKFPLIEQYCSQNIECKPCPQDWKQFHSKCYYFSTEKKSWMDSRIDCIKRGADLVVIKTQEEQEFINQHSGGYYWIGLTCSGTWNIWLWVDETTLQTGFWRNGQPDYGRRYQYCAVTGYKDWSDQPCNLNDKFVCMTGALPSRNSSYN